MVAGKYVVMAVPANNIIPDPVSESTDLIRRFRGFKINLRELSEAPGGRLIRMRA